MGSLDRVRAGLLFDLYGPLLTEHQQEAWQLYYLEDWSLAEISTVEQVSRAAVHDLLDRTEKLLEDYEARLGLLAQHQRRRVRLEEALRLVAQLPRNSREADQVRTSIAHLAEEEGVSDV